ncbi:MAG: hypothetical protein ABEJ99_01415 [Candidatus Nanohaloarchaea archaeon]
MKGQSSMEFLAYISFTMLILAALYTVMIQQQQANLNEQTRNTATMVANRVSFEVEMALVQGEGYSRVFALPTRVGGHNYTVELKRGSAVVGYGNKSIITDSRYRGKPISASVGDDSNVLRVKHNASGVNLLVAN